ncbi:hypothetical protein QZH41_005477 [Actinostola sp. cb2023]|nr:hypothetical protein QZH41_005477 [Actinostola sp. cb2023]
MERSIWYFAAGLLGLRNARKAFPCFDEPEFKAEFQLFITHDKGLQAVSNMPIQRRIVNYKDDHLVDSEFKPTPKMSTYLLQFLVSDFSSFEEKTKCATKIGVWAVENNVNYTCLASSVTKRTLSFFERYTGIQYPLPKLDLAFIPNYYAIAFEGWGFIGFRPKDVLHNEAMDTPAEYFERTDNVAHSVAHMMDLFVYDSMTSLLRLDLPAKNTSTKPTRSPIIRPDKIDLGIIPFRKTFLWRHRYGNVDADDLWKAFESVFSSDDRYGLIYDSFTLASLKFLDLAIALNTTAYLRKEMSFAPFQIGIIDQLLPISNKILLTPSYDKFKKYMISLVKPMLGYLGWDDTGGIQERIGNITGSYLGLAEDFNEEMQLREVEQLVGEHEILRSVETNKTLTTIRKNIQWMGDNAQIITDFLTDQTATMP